MSSRKNIQENQSFIADNNNIPYETIIYYSNRKIILAFFILVVIVMAGLFSIYIENLIVGIILISFGTYFGYRKYKEMKNNEPQIILNQNGIETISTKFKKWADIKNEEISCDGSGNHLLFSLKYDYPGGSEKIKINDFNTNQKQLELLLKTYRNRNSIKTSIPVSSESSKMTDIFNQFFGN